MPRRNVEPDFTVSAEGHLVTNGVWRIDARLTFREGLDPKVAEGLLGEGRLALLEAILREATLGRMQGATSVHLHMDVGGDLRELSLGDFLADPDPTH